MFDIGWFELFIIVVVAVVVVGPKDLPKMMRAIGRWTGRARAMADQFRRSFDDMARQSELEEMRAEMMKIHNDKSLSEIKRETDEMLGRMPSDPTKPLNSPAPSAPRAGAENATPNIAANSIGADPGSAPAAAREPAAEAPAVKPSAPEPQSPLHRDEP
jgi:sec-independent protein translocase protein TatB